MRPIDSRSLTTFCVGTDEGSMVFLEVGEVAALHFVVRLVSLAPGRMVPPAKVYNTGKKKIGSPVIKMKF